MEEPWLDGYDQNPADALSAGFDDRNGDMVIIRNATVHGMSPHHLLPFRGIAHVGLFTGRAPVRLRWHHAPDRRDLPPLHLPGAGDERDQERVGHAPRYTWCRLRDRSRLATSPEGLSPAW